MLTQLEKEEVFDRLKIIFSDITYLPEVEPKLLLAINECDRIELSFANVKNFARRFYETGRYETEDEKKKWREIQWIFATCCVLIVSYQERARERFWHSVSQLVEAYPMFTKLADKDELDLLLKFRNMLVAATLVLNPRLNKELIIYVAGRLEGTQRRYITGKGQRDAVSMRVKIYEQEGQITPEVRPYRSNPDKLNEKRGLSPIDTGKPKKKRFEFQKGSLLPNATMGGMRAFSGAGQLPTVDMGLMSGQNSELPPQYLLSSGSVLSVFDRERAIRNAAHNTLTPSNISHIYGGGQDDFDLSELTAESMIKTEGRVRQAQQGFASSAGHLKKEGQGLGRPHLGMLLDSAVSVEHGPYLNPTLPTPFPSQVQSGSVASYGLGSLPTMSSGYTSRGNFSHSSASMFPSQRNMACPTDVLLDPELHQQSSFSDEWHQYPPYMGAFSNPIDPQHPYRAAPKREGADGDSVEPNNSYSSGHTSKDTYSTNSRSDLSSHSTTDMSRLTGSMHQVYHSDLHTLAAIAAAALSDPDANGLPWQHE